MNTSKRIFLLLTVLTLILAGCFNSIDYKDLLNKELNEIYSLEKVKHLYAIQLETNFKDNYESTNAYINAWLDYLPDDSIKIDSAITVYKDSDEIRLFGEFAFMEGPQDETYEITKSYGLDFDFYVKRNDGVYFKSWAFKQMHDYFGIEAKKDYTDEFIKIYDSEIADEILYLINTHKSISEKGNALNKLLLNEEEIVEDESAKYTYDVNITQVVDNLEFSNSNLSEKVKSFLNITDWEARYILIKERLDNSTFIVNMNDSEKVNKLPFETFYFEASRYVFPYDELIDPR